MCHSQLRDYNQFFYDARGNQVKVVAGDPEGYTYYNKLGLRTGMRDAEGHLTYVNTDNINVGSIRSECLFNGLSPSDVILSRYS